MIAMKKNGFLSVALLAAVLSGCAANEEEPGGDAEIRVGAEVLTAVTKAPVGTGAEFTAAVTAVEVSGSTPPDWTAAPSDGTWWPNSLTLKASPVAGAKVSLNEPKNYHATRTTWLVAWHPEVASVDGVATFVAPDGTQDVMWGGVLKGSKLSPISGAFRFTHALTQLNFMARASGEYLTEGNTVTITGIEVLSARLPQSLTIAEGKLTYAAAAAIAVPAVEPGTKAAVQPLLLTKDAQPFGAPLMIGGMDEVKIKVTYTDDEGAHTQTATIYDTTTSPAAALEVLAGKSHKITLILGQNGLDISATVEEWKDGKEGTVEI